MTKPTTKNTSPNKLSDSEKRRANEIRNDLIQQGVGRDEAEKRAIEMAVKELQSGQGGGKNAGGEPKKGAEGRTPGVLGRG